MFFVLLLQHGKFKLENKFSYFRQYGSSQVLASLMEIQPLAFRRIFTENRFLPIHQILNSMKPSCNDRSKILTAISKMFERQIVEFNRPKTFVNKLKLVFDQFPRTYAKLYKLHRLLNGVFGNKEFLKVELIEPYIFYQ
jgi:hypothetical protein